MRIAAVLSRQAVLAYATGDPKRGLAVGELLHELDDERAVAAIPALTLAEARVHLTQPTGTDLDALRRLHRLADLCAVLPLNSEDAIPLGALTVRLREALRQRGRGTWSITEANEILVASNHEALLFVDLTEWLSTVFPDLRLLDLDAE